MTSEGLVSRGFWFNRFDLIWVDTEFVKGGDTFFAVAAAHLGVATLMVRDAVEFRLILFVAKSAR